MSVLALSACESPTPIIILTVDTLRADHLSTYGYQRATDPNLREFAADAVVFTRAFTPRGKTTPAYASLLTGNYPARHGVRRLGDVLNDHNVTLAERLKDQGYRTGAFVSSTVMVGRLSGLGQGFELWEDHMPSREKNRVNFERKADDVVEVATKWLNTVGPGTLFFLHLIDPHGPYLPPPPFGGHFRASAGREPRWVVPKFQRLDGATTLDDYVAAYDNEIRYADQALGRVLGKLKQRDLFDRALIVVTADHGEAFGEDGLYLRHGEFLHDAVVRVPLLIRPPGGRSRATSGRWDGAVSLTDIAATVMDYIGLPGIDEVDGVSLRSILQGAGGDQQRVVFSENFHSSPQRFAAHHRDGSLRLEGRCTVPHAKRSACSVRTRGTAETLTPELGRHLGSSLEDWIERELAEPVPFATTRSYEPGDADFIERFIDTHNRDLAGGSELTPDDVEGLRSLGYVE